MSLFVACCLIYLVCTSNSSFSLNITTLILYITIILRRINYIVRNVKSLRFVIKPYYAFILCLMIGLWFLILSLYIVMTGLWYHILLLCFIMTGFVISYSVINVLSWLSLWYHILYHYVLSWLVCDIIFYHYVLSWLRNDILLFYVLSYNYFFS